MSNHRTPGPGDDTTWGRCIGHDHDPRTETEEYFWDNCIDDEIFDEDEEEGDDPLEGR